MHIITDIDTKSHFSAYRWQIGDIELFDPPEDIIIIEMKRMSCGRYNNSTEFIRGSSITSMGDPNADRN